jgi:GNAT superfamily N-acetyltransferase
MSAETARPSVAEVKLTGITSYLRPDGRCLVKPDGHWTADQARAAIEHARSHSLTVITVVDAATKADRQVLLDAGFGAARRQAVVEFDLENALVALRHARMPAGVVIRSATEVAVARLRLLDDELRHDVPGTSGWRSSADEFFADTFDIPSFNPKTYLVAVEGTSGEYLALVRVWMNPRGPRVGMIGVRRSCRRRGIASALLAQALQAARATGATAATTEFDVTNRASQAVFDRLGARKIGTTIEFSVTPSGCSE